MERLLNEYVGTTIPDRLIYDGMHPVDGKNITVTLAESSEGVLERGQIIDLTEGVYKVHEKGGAVNCIVASTISYNGTEVVVPVYTSGTFRQDACITGEELTESDLETFRSLGIYLK